LEVFNRGIQQHNTPSLSYIHSRNLATYVLTLRKLVLMNAMQLLHWPFSSQL